MKRTRFAAPLAAAALAALASPWALAQDANLARNLAATCANCHGTNGQAQPGMVSIAGADKAQLAKKLLDYKYGRAPATLMHQLSKGYSDEQLDQLAAHFAALPKQP